MVGEEKS
jgi:hypothetical protein